MRHLLNKHGISDLEIDSAGTAGYHIGKSPDPRMSETLEKRGISVEGNARQFAKSDFEDFDLILPMDD